MTIEQSKPAHRTRPSLTGRLSMGHVIMVTAGLLAVLANFALLRARDETSLVAVAVTDLTRGTKVSADAFRMAEVLVDPDVLSTLVPAEYLLNLEDRIVARAVSQGELVSVSDFVEAAAPSEQRAMSIPVDRVHAAGGMIGDYDVVDVIGVADGVAEYIVLAAPVLDVAPSSGTGLGSSGQYYVTIAVDSLTALRIASALDGGSIEIIRSTGAGEPTQMVFPQPGVSESASSGEPDAGS